jgi:hypothetical protein
MESSYLLCVAVYDLKMSGEAMSIQEVTLLSKVNYVEGKFVKHNLTPLINSAINPSLHNQTQTIQTSDHICCARIIEFDRRYICFALLGGSDYSSRVGQLCIDEMCAKFKMESDDLTKKEFLRDTCVKFDNMHQSNVFSTTSSIQSVNEKVELAKDKMQSNIEIALSNSEKIDNVAENAQKLQEQSEVFRRKSTTLRKRMRCKNAKMTFFIIMIVLIVLAVVLTPIIVEARKNKDNGDEN